MEHLVKFRSEQQKRAVIATAKGISPLFIILPIGTGKSLTFLLPALFDDANTTIVITPLVALAEDILRRCQDAMIDVIIYGRVQARMVRIVIVVTETAVNSSFSQFILDIYLAKKLDRIVFDEAHKLETDLNYRPKLEALRKLVLPISTGREGKGTRGILREVGSIAGASGNLRGWPERSEVTGVGSRRRLSGVSIG
jgi:superfamily II DNA helicase RecQ